MDRRGPVRILGIDPGSQRTGYGLILKNGSDLTHLASGTIAVPVRLPLSERLLAVHRGLRERIEALRPDEVAVEDLFGAANVRAALALGHARGVALLAAAEKGLPVVAYAPAAIKQAVTGTGAAAKSQVGWMVARLLRLPTPPRSADEGDALAVAICHAAHLRRRAGPAVVAIRTSL